MCRYATTAKRVNVRRLKQDIWNNLDQGLLSCRDAANQPADSAQTQDSQPQRDMSFHELVKDMSLTNKQKEASLSFYFVCLLHLANEKVLKIENTPKGDFSDLIVSKDEA